MFLIILIVIHLICQIEVNVSALNQEWLSILVHDLLHGVKLIAEDVRLLLPTPLMQYFVLFYLRCARSLQPVHLRPFSHLLVSLPKLLPRSYLLLIRLRMIFHGVLMIEY